MARSQINIRLNSTTGRQIEELAATTGMSKTTLISTAIDRYYREEREMKHWSEIFGNGMTAEQIIEQIERESPGADPLMKEWIAEWLSRQYDELVSDNPANYAAGRYSDADFVRFTNQIVRESGCEAI